MNQRGFAPLVLILIVGALVAMAGGSVYYQQSAKEPSSGETSSTPTGQTGQTATSKTSPRDDFGCWPPSCSSIPDAQGKKACEDWKAGKVIQWPPSCSSLGQSACQKLCEVEKKTGPQPTSGNFQQGYTQQQSYSNNQRTTSVPTQKQVFNTLPSLVKAEFASDVSAEDKNFAIEGVSTMDFYLQKWFGKSTNKPSGLQVSAATSDSSGGARVNTESGTAIIMIETGNFGWQRQIQSNKDVGGEWRPRLVAHEYVHVYQFQNGCGRVDAENPVALKWFIEGEADWLSYKSAIVAGQLPQATIPQLITAPAKQVVGSLQSFEKSESVKLTASSPIYFLFNMAIDYLMKDKPIKNLDTYCADIGNGMDVSKAFETAFGVTLPKFYEGFEAYRKTW